MSAKKKFDFPVNTKVFAKVRGYPAWPARVEECLGPGEGTANTKYKVFFYGTYENASVKGSEMWLYNEESKAKYGKQKRKGFAEGLNEIENNPDIRTVEQLDAMGVPPAPEEQVDAAPEEPMEETEAKDEADEAQDEVEKKTETPTEPKGKAKRKSAAQTPASAKPATPAARPARGSKRKAAPDAATPTAAAAASTPTPAPPPAKMAKPDPEAATPTSAEERTSRSGRVIKPKAKFGDEAGQDTPRKKDERKMYVQIRATGDIIEVNLDKDRPIKFESKESEIMWEKATAKNALKFKEKVETGEFIPEEVINKIKEKVTRTKEEEEILKREEELKSKNDKIRWLRTEQRLIDLDISIKQSLHFEHPNMDSCLKALDELATITPYPLMLKKQPDIVTTVRRLRKYVGPQTTQTQTEGQENRNWMAESEKIRIKAEQMYKRFLNSFVVPEGGNMWDAFETKLSEFKDATKGMGEKELISLIEDPTKE